MIQHGHYPHNVYIVLGLTSNVETIPVFGAMGAALLCLCIRDWSPPIWVSAGVLASAP